MDERGLMTLEEMKQHEWVVSWSGGKDSTATVILMHEYGVPIKEIIYVRMMYDDKLPATLPVMTDFVDWSSDVLRSWGYTVKIVPSVKTAVDLINMLFKRSKHIEFNGHHYGAKAFMRGGCCFSGKGKIRTVQKVMDPESYQMIGYACDEEKRIVRLGDKRQSIMVALGVKEEETFEICRKYGLLSPLYDLGMSRDGCFFCPNANKREREYLKRTRPDLVELIWEMCRMTEYDIVKTAELNSWCADYVELFKSKERQQEMDINDLL